MYSNLSLFKFTLHFTAIPIVWLVIYTITASYSYYIYYNDSALSFHPYIKNFFSIIFYFCSLMTVICHTMSMYTEPGLIDQQEVSRLKSTKKTFCKKCNKYRPLRAHHCSTCKKCVMKLDHHCPWIFNCVGYKNQKIFFLFVIYTNIGCLIAVIMFVAFFCSSSFKDLVDIAKDKKRNLEFAVNNMLIFGTKFKKIGDILMLCLVTGITFLTLLSVFALFLSQVYLIKRNITNIEADTFRNRDDLNPYYSKGISMMNVVMGMGPKWKWFFPIVEPNLYNGGYIYSVLG